MPVSDIAFRPLNTLQRVFPVTERTNFSSVRFDTNINNANQFNVRFGYNTELRVGYPGGVAESIPGPKRFFTHRHHETLKTHHSASNSVSNLSSAMVNELRFSFGRRKTRFLSQNGRPWPTTLPERLSSVVSFSQPVDRTEMRYQFLDNLTWVTGATHSNSAATTTT